MILMYLIFVLFLENKNGIMLIAARDKKNAFFEPVNSINNIVMQYNKNLLHLEILKQLRYLVIGNNDNERYIPILLGLISQQLPKR